MIIRTKPAEYTDYEYVELESSARKIGVEVERVKEPADMERVGRKMRDRCVLFVNVKPLKMANAIDFSTCMNNLKRRCDASGSSIFFADEGWVLIAPKGMDLHREF